MKVAQINAMLSIQPFSEKQHSKTDIPLGKHQKQWTCHNKADYNV